MYMKKYYLLILAASFLIYGCEDKNQIAQAQTCLDSVSQNSPGDALTCLTYIESDTSQQADIIRCSGWLMAGGLTTTKMVSAYKALSGTTSGGAAVTNKEAVFIGTLVLNNPDLTVGYNRALTGDGFCKKSNVSGLMYISGLAVTGTLLAKVGSDIATPFSNPPTEAEINAAIDDCTSGAPTSSACSPATIGTVASTIATAYCAAQSADQSVCATVNDAINAGGGDTAKVGNGLLCLLKKGTYDPNTDTCT